MTMVDYDKIRRIKEARAKQQEIDNLTQKLEEEKSRNDRLESIINVLGKEITAIKLEKAGVTE